MSFAPRDARSSRRWLSDSGAFLFGKYAGDLVEDVAREDTDYLRWAVETVEDMDEDDRRVIEQQLTFVQRGRRR